MSQETLKLSLVSDSAAAPHWLWRELGWVLLHWLSILSFRYSSPSFFAPGLGSGVSHSGERLGLALGTDPSFCLFSFPSSGTDLAI